MCLVSIVVPVYNVDKYLSKCIDSLIKQTFTNIEIILVDDGSTDKSSIICDEYAKKDERIKVIHKLNGGLSDARNVGLDQSTGDYIVFIDSDDWVSLNMIEILYNHLDKYNADIVQGKYIEAYSEDVTVSNYKYEKVICYDSEQMLANLYKENDTQAVIVCNKLYKRELFNKIRFPKGKLHEDEFTTYKLFHKAKSIIETNQIIYYYRQRTGSIMNSEFNIRRLDSLEAWKERKAYFNSIGLTKLEDKTEALICSHLKYFCIKVKESNLYNKKKVLKDLKKEMRSNFKNFIINKEVSLKGKLTLIICILNTDIFYMIYKYLIQKQENQ